MNILRTTDTTRHHFERQTPKEKKQKKLPPHEKILMPPHIAHICLCPQPTNPTQGQSQKSAISNALSNAVFQMKSVCIDLGIKTLHEILSLKDLKFSTIIKF